MIHLSEALRKEMEDHAEAVYPLECCGALLGRVEGEVRIVEEVRRLENTYEPNSEFEHSIGSDNAEVVLHGQERRFQIDPKTLFNLMREERKTGRKVLGYYHSHPDHPAVPSAYDLAWAMAWYVYPILSIQKGKTEKITSWRLNATSDAFIEETIMVL